MKKKEDDKQKKDLRRKHTSWGDIGLEEYNPQKTKSGCRFEHCQLEMITERQTRYRRNKNIQNATLGDQKSNSIPIPKRDLLLERQITHSYRIGAASRKSRCRNMHKPEDGRHARGERIKMILKMKGNMPELRLQTKIHIPIPTNKSDGFQ